MSPAVTHGAACKVPLQKVKKVGVRDRIWVCGIKCRCGNSGYEVWNGVGTDNGSLACNAMIA